MKPLHRIIFPKIKLNKAKLKELNGKTVLITGASFGIGATLCEELAKAGCNMILVARTEEKLIEMKKLCIELGASDCTYFICNLYDLESVKELCNRLHQEYSYINFFVSNAGKSIMRSFEASKDRWQDITRTLSVNFESPVYIIQNCYDLFQKKGARIVNVSALNLLMPPTPYWAAYQSSKAAFNQWCYCNKAEWEEDKVLLRTVYFPLVNTRMSQANELYKNTPKMSPDQAAKRIVRLMYSSREVEKPWWSNFFVFLFTFKNLWSRTILKRYKK